ncbi:hypothetical protein PIROE2DRAFT_60440 [Piromyces sp. E2]|nr:hypothetical protein PIROE2DRAFT_60440 [Piromyces sp. E2]|eukprot:OUM64754.1 hypothetical protein PIROE2DRAFT_60440 [Piromyces sp. E2]
MIQEEEIFDLSEKVLITFKNEEYILNAYALLSKDVGSSKTVTLDLLTLDDVKRLRENRGDDGRADTADSNKPSKNKLFLILTYSAAFDRVHYPLPLTFQGFDDDVSSVTLIEKLKKEIELLKNEKENNINEISKSKYENDKKKLEDELVSKNEQIDSLKRNTSRNSSVSSFKRFDPTAYIKEREKKLEERRARRSKSIDRGSIAKKKTISDSKIYGSKYNRSSSTVRNSSTKNSRNNSLSKISYTSSRNTVKPSNKRSTSKVTKSRNSSLSSTRYGRDSSISKRTSTTNLSYTNASKKYTSSKISQVSKSSIGSSRKIYNNVPTKYSNKAKSKTSERIIIKKTKGYDDQSTRENDTVDYESQYLYDNDFEEMPTEYNNETNNNETEGDNHWNSYDINDSQDIDARLEAIQKYLKDTQEEL